MKNMQWHFLKILFVLIAALFFGTHNLAAQVSSFRLQQADSLFQAKQYTQSMELYRAVFEQKQYTPAMLLKMAFVEEGLGQTGQALYYLNLYYRVSNDQTALEKMEELATKYNLEGYDQAETDWALSHYHDYHSAITIALAAFVILFASLGIYFKRQGERPVASAITMVVLLVIMGVHVNLGGRITAGIIAQQNTYAMSGPSAGATVTAVLDSGHRVEVIGKRDVWVKILWQGETLYIKEGTILPITL
jgi:tetratricopeptide (TPR) repeat protein